MTQDSRKEIASRSEMDAALESLSNAQLLRLRSYAEFRVKGLGRKAMGRTADDLIQEAGIRALEGIRNWPKDSVDFFGFLKGTIRSISHTWKKTVVPDEPVLASDLIVITSNGDVIDPLSAIPSDNLDPEGAIIRQEDRLSDQRKLEEIEGLFKDDKLVLDIIDGIEADMSGPEIQELLGISKTQYETAMRRMRRKIRKETGTQ